MHRPLAMMMILLAGVSACSGPQAPSEPKEATDAPKAAADAPKAPHGSSGHGYALLNHLLDQERHVAMLLIIKRERDELETVIDAIDHRCDKAFKDLAELAKADPGIDLEDTGFPIEETLTRDAIGETRKHELLAAKGRELEFELLLTQNEALTYAAHLAETLSRNESDPARLAYERELWKDLSKLQKQARDLLRRPPPVEN